MKKLDFAYKRTSKVVVPLDTVSFMAVRARYLAAIECYGRKTEIRCALWYNGSASARYAEGAWFESREGVSFSSVLLVFHHAAQSWP
jgi:hypothetical protein